MNTKYTEVVVVGTGIVGISSAYYLIKNHGYLNVTLIDSGQAMAFTSAQSGENYRNWWPHPDMVAFTNRSIDLLEDISRESGNRINMNRRGYALATREKNIDDLVTQLHAGLGESTSTLLRYHESHHSANYQPPESADWQAAPIGVDILQNKELIRKTFPSYAEDIQTIIHIRRGGDISSQQLGMLMLDYLKEKGIKRICGTVVAVTQQTEYRLEIQTAQGVVHRTAEKLVNAAGPFAKELAEMLDVSLPIFNTFQQKIAFEDRQKVIPRNMPFSIDLDAQQIDWLAEERELILEDPDFRWLAEQMPGSIHCRPDGGDYGTWLKLGWAYNNKPATASRELPLDENFPEIVLRGAARLHPKLKAYYGQLPRSMHHYGGWYTMTTENWPLIGPMGPEGAFINSAHSGFGTMAACAAGELCAAWVAGDELPFYANKFAISRYADKALMKLLLNGAKGIL